MYFVVKVTAGQEKIAAGMLQNKLGKDALQSIYSILVAEGIRGYIVVEAENEVEVRAFITKERNIKGILPLPLTEDEVKKFLAVKSHTQEIEKGDTIEFTTGPFKGYKAKVLKVDTSKNDVTVELMDVVVPIPLTTKMNTAKVIEKVQKRRNHL